MAIYQNTMTSTKKNECKRTKEKPFHSKSNTEFCVELDKGRRFKHHKMKVAQISAKQLLQI